MSEELAEGMLPGVRMIANTPCFYRMVDDASWQPGMFLGIDDDGAARVRTVDLAAPDGTRDIRIGQRLRMVGDPPAPEQFVRRADVAALRTAAWLIVDRCHDEGEFDQEEVDALRAALGERRLDEESHR